MKKSFLIVLNIRNVSITYLRGLEVAELEESDMPKLILFLI